MTTSATFPAPKDPADSAWYQLRFGERLAALVRLTVTETSPDDTQGQGTWTTPGDSAPATPLEAHNGQLTLDGYGVAMLISGGVPGSSYAVTAEVTTDSGGTLSRSAILAVTGL